MEQNVKWVANLLLGVEASPHNFVPRVELIDALRVNSVGLYAYELFNSLKVRYIQV